MWRWLAEASRSPRAAIRPGERSGERFEVTRKIRVLLAYWHGNASAVHRQLVARAETGGREGPPTAASGSAASPAGAPPTAVPLLDPVPSLSTLLRAVRRDLTAGERAGLAGGERAARKHDVFLTRPRSWRNHVWETDHVQVPVLVDVEGKARRPWITWFTDCATNVITGVAVTPGHPSRESVLAALRSAVLREDPYGPFGGLPEKVRVDRGKDFLSRTVTAAFGLLDVTVEDLPAYTPHLKGTVEGLNRAVESMFLASLPGHGRQPRSGKRASRPKDEVLLSFEEFTARLLARTLWWNTEHRPTPLRGRTPLEAWQDDPAPLRDVPAADLWTFTLEDAGTRTLTSRGIRFRRRDYVGPWMTGQAGIQVRVRFMPHYDHEIDICGASGKYLGPAHLADAATPEQLDALRTARAERARRLRAEVKAAEALRRQRFAPATTAEPPQRLGAITSAQAGHELAALEHTDASKPALPDLIPPAAPPADWRTPPSLATRTAPGRPAPLPSEPASDGPPGPSAQTAEDGDAS